MNVLIDGDKAESSQIKTIEKGSTTISENELKGNYNTYEDRSEEIEDIDSMSWAEKGAKYRCNGSSYSMAALKCYDNATRLDKNNVFAWEQKGGIYNYLHHYSAALSCFDIAVSLEQDNPEIWLGKAIAENALGMRNEAIQSYQNFLKLDISEFDVDTEVNVAKKRLNILKKGGHTNADNEWIKEQKEAAAPIDLNKPLDFFLKDAENSRDQLIDLLKNI